MGFCCALFSLALSFALVDFFRLNETDANPPKMGRGLLEKRKKRKKEGGLSETDCDS